jgi:2-phosphoglycerate kinase
MSGVDVADVLPFRLMFTTQCEEAEPHVVAAVHMLPGLVSEQMYLLFFTFLRVGSQEAGHRRTHEQKRTTPNGNAMLHLHSSPHIAFGERAKSGAPA